jgi:hypothetical protein
MVDINETYKDEGLFDALNTEQKRVRCHYTKCRSQELSVTYLLKEDKSPFTNTEYIRGRIALKKIKKINKQVNKENQTENEKAIEAIETINKQCEVLTKVQTDTQLENLLKQSHILVLNGEYSPKMLFTLESNLKEIGHNPGIIYDQKSWENITNETNATVLMFYKPSFYGWFNIDFLQKLCFRTYQYYESISNFSNFSNFSNKRSNMAINTDQFTSKDKAIKIFILANQANNEANKEANIKKLELENYFDLAKAPIFCNPKGIQIININNCDLKNNYLNIPVIDDSDYIVLENKKLKTNPNLKNVVR